MFSFSGLERQKQAEAETKFWGYKVNPPSSEILIPLWAATHPISIIRSGIASFYQSSSYYSVRNINNSFSLEEEARMSLEEAKGILASIENQEMKEIYPPDFLSKTYSISTNLWAAREVPKWRSVLPGLNFEVICAEENCPLFNKLVWKTLETGQFDAENLLFDQEISCSLCASPTDQIAKLAFFQCEFTIIGRKVEPNREEIRIVDRIAGSQLCYYDSPTVQWVDLKITARPI